MMSFVRLSIVLLFLIASTQSSPASRVYNFSIGWVTKNPDGRHERRVIGVNGDWPPPIIEATMGDRIVVTVSNDLPNTPTSLHFHGLFQNQTAHMDGAIGATQCHIPPGSSMTYNFTVEQPGTYWYHSHETSQYPDGLRGPLIVHDPDNPYHGLYDEDLVLTLSDWYHDEMSTIVHDFLSVTNPTGAEPVPQSALHNDTNGLEIHVEAGKTYFLRIINMGAFAGQYFWIEDHKFSIIELDGVYHEPMEVDMIYLTAAQRVGVLLTTKSDTLQNYPIVTAMDMELFDTTPDDLVPNMTSYLVYNSSQELRLPAALAAFDAADDFDLVPTDREELFKDPDKTISLDVVMDNLGDGANYAFFNNVTYKAPVVPTLYTVLSADGDYVNEPTIYGTHTNTFVLEQGRVIELVLNNRDDGKHPFHLHGHNFQVLVRSEDDAGDWNPSNNSTFPLIPMRRDTVLLRPNGHLVVRFRSDNPGAPETIRTSLNIPDDHLAVCRDDGLPTSGNAAGRTDDWLDLAGEPSPPAPLPDGFTTRGMVALVFSIFCGLLGTVATCWYAYAEEDADNENDHDNDGRAQRRETDDSSGGRSHLGDHYVETDRLLQARVMED